MSGLKKMRRCVVCKAYTLSESHCGKLSVSAHPARFNPNDPYGDYRRQAAYPDHLVKP
jgi:rRNA maturation protein Nop10